MLKGPYPRNTASGGVKTRFYHLPSPKLHLLALAQRRLTEALGAAEGPFFMSLVVRAMLDGVRRTFYPSETMAMVSGSPHPDWV